MPKGIAYQNKDVLFKILSETYKEKSFRAYGLDLPRIKEVLPTNLPAISADEKRIDNLFLLEDDTLAVVDYEAEDKVSNRIKYINYIARVLEKYYQDEQSIPYIRLIIIYTGDVENACGVVEAGCFSLRMEQVFLVKLQSEEIYQHIKAKIERHDNLTEEELMRLIILPLTERGAEKKKIRIEQVIELAKEMPEDSQAFLLANLMVASDKFIDKEFSDKIGRWLSMTKIARSIAEEAIGKRDRELAKKMIMDGLDIEKIVRYTSLSEEEIEVIKEELLKKIQNVN